MPTVPLMVAPAMLLTVIELPMKEMPAPLVPTMVPALVTVVAAVLLELLVIWMPLLAPETVAPAWLVMVPPPF